MLISFEGIDGCGKSTQISILKEKLITLGFSVQVFREPGGTEVSEQIRSILLNTGLDINPVAELLLFSSARAQLMAEKVLPALEKGGVVILDRFYDSTTAYQGYGRESLPLPEIEQINHIASHQRAPDVTFYMKISVEESQKRTSHLEKDRMEQAGEHFFEKVIAGFDELSKKDSRFKIIDASQTVEDIHDQIMKELLTYL